MRSVRSGLVFVLLLAAGAALGCRGKKDLVGTASASVGSSTAAADAGAPAAAGECPAVDRAKVAPFEVEPSPITTAVPPILDAKESLAPFYDRILALARGTAKRHVRVGFYGDSNLTSDFLTGHVRRALQTRFGDAGHGYVALARPWPWYTHEDVHHHGTWPLFKQIACTTDPVPGHRYGFANMGAESNKSGAAAWVGTADESSAIGRTASRFDVYFLKQPKGGSFDLELDGKVLRTVRTAAEGFEAGFEPVETTDAAHELRCVVKGDGIVRLFGATLERDPGAPSIVVDSLGTGSLNFQRFMLTEPATRKTQLEHRSYDLVVVWLGMNSMWLPPNRAWVRDTITTLNDALPGVPVLVLSPPDSVKEGDSKTDPRILGLVKQLREVSAETGAAFWDFREAMGGDGSFVQFMRRRLASPDRAHLLRAGGTLMGQRFLSALFSDVGKRLASRPDAGCR